MPPKRDMRNRGKGKGKMKEKVVEVEPFNPCEELKPMALVAGFRQTTEKLDEETKEILQFQISKCKEKLEFYQRKADELAVKAQCYPQQFDQMDVDKKDLSSYLQWCLQEKEDTLNALKAEHEDCKTMKQEQDDEQRKQLEDARIQLDEMKIRMRDENDAMRVQLVAMKSVNDDRQEIRDEISHLTKEFNETKQLNKEKIYQLERTATMDVERLRRAATVRIGRVAEECTIAAEKQLRATVKQCTIDSVRATALIAAKYSDASMSRLLAKNDALRHRTDENQRVIEILEANRVVLDKENLRQHEATEVLVQKIKDHECLDLDFRYQQTDREILRQLKFMKDVVDDERKSLINATERRQKLKKNLDEVNSEAKSTAVTNEDLYDTLTAATPGLQQILPSSSADLLRKLDTLAAEDAFKRMEPSEAPPPPRRQRLRLPKRKTTGQNCITKSA